MFGRGVWRTGMTDSPPPIVLAAPSPVDAPPRLILPPSGSAFVTPVLRGPAGGSGDDTNVVHTTGDETIAGDKTFTSPVVSRADYGRFEAVNTSTTQFSNAAVNLYSPAESMTGAAGVSLQAYVNDTMVSEAGGQFAWIDRVGNFVSSIMSFTSDFFGFHQQVDMTSHKIVNVADGTDAGDAVNKGQLDAVSGASAVFGEVPLRFGTMATLTIGHDFVSGSTSVFRNGLREEVGVGYTESLPDAIILTTAPLTSDVISVDYLIAT